MRKIFDKFERIDPFIKMAMECLAIFIALCVLMQVVLYEAIIPSGSMYPTIAYPSLNFGYRLAYKISEPQRGDIVYFKRDTDNVAEQQVYIKRIIGVPGDVVEEKDGVFYLNGEVLKEDYLNEEPEKLNFGPFNVPDGCYFMMGDNRNHSYDSRYWDEARIKIEHLDKGWYDCIAVKYYDAYNIPETEKIKALRAANTQAYCKYNELASAFHFTNAKAEYIGCKNCGSKIARKYLRRNFCPVCNADLRPETTLNRIAALKAKADKSSDTLKAELTKQAMKAKNVRWLVKIEFHE